MFWSKKQLSKFSLTLMASLRNDEWEVSNDFSSAITRNGIVVTYTGHVYAFSPGTAVSFDLTPDERKAIAREADHVFSALLCDRLSGDEQ